MPYVSVTGKTISMEYSVHQKKESVIYFTLLCYYLICFHKEKRFFINLHGNIKL